jgi:type 1 glutamine amidotransferase
MVFQPHRAIAISERGIIADRAPRVVTIALRRPLLLKELRTMDDRGNRALVIHAARPDRAIGMRGALGVLLVSLLVVVPTAGRDRQMPLAGTATDVPPIRALYVTGGGFHEFVKQEAILPPAVGRNVRVDWTIDHTAGTSTDVMIERHRTADWTRDFDVVLYNMSFSFVVDVEWIERLAAAHRDSGVGAVILHGAVHSYRRSKSRAWGELMGAFSLRHDAQRPLTVETVLPGHPIMRGVPAMWVTTSEELYELEQVWPGMTPLAQSFSIESKKHHPIIWTNTHGKSRVFVTSLGHNTEMIADPVYLGLVTRGLLWTTGKLQDDGTPAPGYSAR